MIVDSIKSSLCLGKSSIYDAYVLNPNLWDDGESSGCITWIYKLTNDGGLEKDDIILHVVAHLYQSEWEISYFWSWLVNGHTYFSQNIIYKESVADTLVRKTLEEIKNNARLDDFKMFSSKPDIKFVKDLLIKSGFY